MNGLHTVVVASILIAAVSGGFLGAARTGEAPPASRRARKFADPSRIGSLRRRMAALRPLHKKLGRPRPGEWLYHHKEPGQTFAQYVRSRPVVPDRRRKVIYVQPLGQFTTAQRKIVDQTAKFIGLYYGLEVKVLKDMPLSLIPARARRTHPSWGDKQILTGYVLENVLRPRLAKDAFASIALTGSDLWPGRGWNFVFGQASLRERVGVWSLYRNGDPNAGPKEYRLCLLRTIKTAVHELGHMFSMLHCTAYECNMCGSNSRTESDARPVALCPECLGKLCWASGVDIVERYGKLAAFFDEAGLKDQGAFCRKSMKALGVTTQVGGE